jgi:hypothetical protein
VRFQRPQTAFIERRLFQCEWSISFSIRMIIWRLFEDERQVFRQTASGVNKDQNQPLCKHDFVLNLDRDSPSSAFRNFSKNQQVLLSQHALHDVFHRDVLFKCIRSVCSN